MTASSANDKGAGEIRQSAVKHGMPAPACAGGIGELWAVNVNTILPCSPSSWAGIYCLPASCFWPWQQGVSVSECRSEQLSLERWLFKIIIKSLYQDPITVSSPANYVILWLFTVCSPVQFKKVFYFKKLPLGTTLQAQRTVLILELYYLFQYYSKFRLSWIPGDQHDGSKWLITLG